MIPFRDESPEQMSKRRQDIVRLARHWIGTPYHHQASLQGVGCDCLGLVRGVWRELYGEEPEALVAYTADWGEVAGSETLFAAAERNLVQVGQHRYGPGDVLIFRLRAGAIAKHAGIAASRQTMIHAQEGVAVSEVFLGRWWRRRIAGAFSFPGVTD